MFKFKLFIKSLFLSTLAVSAISNALAKNSDYDPILKADFSKIPQYKLALEPKGENETDEERKIRMNKFYTSEKAVKAYINLFKNKKAKEIIYNALNKKSLTDEEIVKLINNEVGGEFVFLKEPDTFKLTKKFDVTLKTKKQMPYKLSNLYNIFKERGVKTNLISATLPFFYYKVK
ncbi:hypothetical protein [Avibacterium avium]|uniref:hypothetical protein n=1 Tax=Avibacterium avium TaxID=751 RepID=UPI003BF78783